jgi:hypothetical protein
MTFKNITRGDVDSGTRASFISRLGRGNVVLVKGLRGQKDVPQMVIKKDGSDVYVKPYDGAINARHARRDHIDHKIDGKKVSTEQIIGIAISR